MLHNIQVGDLSYIGSDLGTDFLM